ncbi:MAG: S24 family peptidase, partial [Pseudomonadota bacterium]
MLVKALLAIYLRTSHNRLVNNMDLILSQIDKALKEKGLSDAAASRLAVGHTSLIKNFRMKREGEKRYNLAALEKLAEVLDLELYFGPPRETGDAPHHIIEGDDYAKIAFYDVPASAGPGAAADPNASIESYAFRRDWLKRLGVAPQNAAMLRVRGDSMAPKIVDGDVLLIDTARREPPIRPQTKGKARSGIYVVDVDGETRVKRVERPDFQNLIL